MAYQDTHNNNATDFKESNLEKKADEVGENISELLRNRRLKEAFGI